MTRLRADAAVHVLDGKVAVRSPDGSLVLLEAKDAAGLARQLAAGTAPPEVTERLRKAGLVGTDAAGAADLVAGTAPALMPLRRGVVRLVGDGVAVQAALEALQELGAPHERTLEGADAGADVVLLALDRWDLARIEAWNAEATARRQPWLAACATEARRVQVGPLVVPGETACYACYTARRLADAWRPDALASHFDALRAAPGPDLLPAMWSRLAGQLGAWEAVRFQRGLAPASLGAAVSLGADGLDTASDVVPKAPRCEVCSRHNAQPPHEPWMPLPGGPASPPS
jgi:bacteriocin biosynthesis cyclodehydratase domain-containing protein